MATKPDVTLARWATGGTAVVVDPPSGARDTGFVAGDPVEEGSVNALLKQLYLWALYLNDGALTGDHTITGNLSVNGTLAAAHGSKEVCIGAADFVADSGASNLSQAGYLSVTSAAIAYAPLRLDVGKRITSVQVFYNVNSAGAVQPKLQRMDLATGAVTAIWTGTSDSSGSSIESQSDSPNHTVLTGTIYWIECGMTSASNRLYGAKVVYDQPSP